MPLFSFQENSVNTIKVLATFYKNFRFEYLENQNDFCKSWWTWLLTFMYKFIGLGLKLRVPRAAFFFHTQQKNTATYFFGKCYSWRLLGTCCNFRLLQQKNVATFVQQNQISLILLQFICNIFNVLQHNFSLRSIFSRGPYVQHIFAANTTVILS